MMYLCITSLPLPAEPGTTCTLAARTMRVHGPGTMLHAFRSAETGMLRRLVLALLFCVLATRVAVPAGWMPDTGPAGPRIALCNGMAGAGAAQALLDKALGKTKSDKASAGEPCGFAAAALAFAAPEPAPFLHTPRVSNEAPRPARQLASIGQGLAAPPPPAIGPPLRA